MQHSQLCGLLFGGVRHILAAAHNHRMTAGGFLYMEPDILAAGSVQGQLIVLQVVAPDQNFKAIAGTVAQEIRRFLFAFPLLIVFQVALAFQFGAHFVQGLLAGGSLHLIQHVGKVFDLILALEQQLFQHLAGGLLLFIIAEVFLRVLVGSKAGVQADGHILAGIVVLHGGLAVAFLDGPLVGLQQLAVQAQGIGFFTLGQFLPPGGLFAHSAFVQVMHRFVQLAALLLQPLGAVLGGVIILQQLAVGGVLR